MCLLDASTYTSSFHHRGFFFFFWLHVPRPGIEPAPSAVAVQSQATGAPGKFPFLIVCVCVCVSVSVCVCARVLKPRNKSPFLTLNATRNPQGPSPPIALSSPPYPHNQFHVETGVRARAAELEPLVQGEFRGSQQASQRQGQCP